MTWHEVYHPISSHFHFDYAFPIFTVSPGFLFLSSVCLAKASPGVVSAAVGTLSLWNGCGGFDDSGREVVAGLLLGGGGGTVFWPGFSAY